MKQKIPMSTESIDSCPGVKMYGSVVVGTKGQIVIPSEVRKALDIKPGDTMVVVTKHGKAVGLVKMDDLDQFMEYLHQEIDSFKAASKIQSESKEQSN